MHTSSTHKASAASEPTLICHHSCGQPIRTGSKATDASGMSGVGFSPLTTTSEAYGNLKVTLSSSGLTGREVAKMHTSSTSEVIIFTHHR